MQGERLALQKDRYKVYVDPKDGTRWKEFLDGSRPPVPIMDEFGNRQVDPNFQLHDWVRDDGSVVQLTGKVISDREIRVKELNTGAVNRAGEDNAGREQQVRLAHEAAQQRYTDNRVKLTLEALQTVSKGLKETAEWKSATQRMDAAAARMETARSAQVAATDETEAQRYEEEFNTAAADFEKASMTVSEALGKSDADMGAAQSIYQLRESYPIPKRQKAVVRTPSLIKSAGKPVSKSQDRLGIFQP